MNVKKWFAVGSALAFLGVISLFQTNSYAADKHNLNAAFVIGGIVFLASAGYVFYKKVINGNTTSRFD